MSVGLVIMLAVVVCVSGVGSGGGDLSLWGCGCFGRGVSRIQKGNLENAHSEGKSGFILHSFHFFRFFFV